MTFSSRRAAALHARSYSPRPRPSPSWPSIPLHPFASTLLRPGSALSGLTWGWGGDVRRWPDTAIAGRGGCREKGRGAVRRSAALACGEIKEGRWRRRPEAPGAARDGPTRGGSATTGGRRWRLEAPGTAEDGLRDGCTG
jgi:hypothetical protein